MHIDTTATVGLRGLAAIHIMVTSDLIDYMIIHDFENKLSNITAAVPLRGAHDVRQRGPGRADAGLHLLPAVRLLSDAAARLPGPGGRPRQRGALPPGEAGEDRTHLLHSQHPGLVRLVRRQKQIDILNHLIETCAMEYKHAAGRS